MTGLWPVKILIDRGIVNGLF